RGDGTQGRRLRRAADSVLRTGFLSESYPIASHGDDILQHQPFPAYAGFAEGRETPVESACLGSSLPLSLDRPRTAEKVLSCLSGLVPPEFPSLAARQPSPCR